MLAAGPDDALWFTLNQANAIGRIDLDGDGEPARPAHRGGRPVGITLGGDGALWFVEIVAGQLGRITPDGRIDEFPLPDRAARPHAIVADPAGGCWFTEWGANRIGHIDPAGRNHRATTCPPRGSEPHGLTVTPDGTVWVALETGAVAHLTRHPDPEVGRGQLDGGGDRAGCRWWRRGWRGCPPGR